MIWGSLTGRCPTGGGGGYEPTSAELSGALADARLDENYRPEWESTTIIYEDGSSQTIVTVIEGTDHGDKWSLDDPDNLSGTGSITVTATETVVWDSESNTAWDAIIDNNQAEFDLMASVHSAAGAAYIACQYANMTHAAGMGAAFGILGTALTESPIGGIAAAFVGGKIAESMGNPVCDSVYRKLR